MTPSETDLREWMNKRENEHLEFKEARNQYSRDDLRGYCAAFYNEGGGCLVLGITDKKPRKVVGTKAFLNIESAKKFVFESLGIRVDFHELSMDTRRVVVIDVPGKASGESPKRYKGRYLSRVGESLVDTPEHTLRKMLADSTASSDFSATICNEATFQDLDSEAIEIFRQKWIRKTGSRALAIIPHEQLLNDAELIKGQEITHAALILLGKQTALDRLMPQAEIIFEYRSSETSIPYQDRENYRNGFFLIENQLPERINLRNDLHHFQDGLFIWDIPTFNEEVVREAILNAVAHRDYTNQASVLIRQYPKSLKITSPGGLPDGVTIENLLERTVPRNRRIAEILEKCGLVERSGQGMDKIYRKNLEEGKPLPSFSGTDEHCVVINLKGNIQDHRFLKFLEEIGQETLETFGVEDLMLLDCIFHGKRIKISMRERAKIFVENGIVERKGRGFILSRRFYRFLDKKGIYTRKKGLDKHTKKELLLRHIKGNKKTGSPMKDLLDVLPELSRRQIQFLLENLREERSICLKGRGRGAKWYPVVE